MTTRGTAPRTKRGRAAHKNRPALALPEPWCCLRSIDWSGRLHATAPGRLADDVVLCNSCAWQAAETAIAGSAVEAT